MAGILWYWDVSWIRRTLRRILFCSMRSSCPLCLISRHHISRRCLSHDGGSFQALCSGTGLYRFGLSVSRSLLQHLRVADTIVITFFLPLVCSVQWPKRHNNQSELQPKETPFAVLGKGNRNPVVHLRTEKSVLHHYPGPLTLHSDFTWLWTASFPRGTDQREGRGSSNLEGIIFYN